MKLVFVLRHKVNMAMILAVMVHKGGALTRIFFFFFSELIE